MLRPCHASCWRILRPQSFSTVRQRAISTTASVDVTEPPRPPERTPRWLAHLLKGPSEAPRVFRYSCEGAVRDMDPGITDASDPRRICIIGAGNLGRLFAMALANLPSRPPITLVVHRKELLDQWAAKPGISMTWHGKTQHNAEFDIELWSSEPSEAWSLREVTPLGRTISNLIICTKAGAALPEADRLRRYLGPQSNVVFVQNGMNKLWPPYGKMYLEKRFANVWPLTWMHCVVTHGVTSEGPFKSTLASPADAVLGTVMPGAVKSEYLANQILAARELAARKVPRGELWVRQLEKLGVNSIINPLTAVLRCQNGALIEDGAHPDIGKVINLLLKEASGVLQALIQHESSEDILWESPMEKAALSERLSYPALSSMFRQVAEKVRANTSSMLQDVQAGKPTEVRDFNGWFVEMATFLNAGLDVSTHEALMRLVEDGHTVEGGSSLGEYLHVTKTILRSRETAEESNPTANQEQETQEAHKGATSPKRERSCCQSS